MRWLLVLALIFITNSPAQAADRRETGEGKTGVIRQGELAIAGFWRLADGREASNCYSTSPVDGLIISGVVNPYPEELQGKVVCKFVYIDRSIQVTNVLIRARLTSGEGNWIYFQKGSKVAGGIVHPRGYLADTACVLHSSPADGWAYEAVISPFDEEVSNLAVCNNRSLGFSPEGKWSDWQRRVSGVGNSLEFQALQPVAGGLINLSNGKKDSVCFLAKPETSGSAFESVIWPYSKEVQGLRDCVPK